ncbi:MAG: hypothetical protein CMB99_15445 [Flavobacteriaceae bacterium]|jgi:hypothetical protein|nr:hypothetical protein [Flavobacteriaceae bacterium]|tara:strand:+ start:38344 stop:38616 length:273 start_codon:yes stop_codon:yes gene_type:complete
MRIEIEGLVMTDLQNLEIRVKSLEEWRNTQTTDAAVRKERDKHMDQRFDELKESVNEVKGYLLRIVWVIILGIIGSLITFVISGGLNVGI